MKSVLTRRQIFQAMTTWLCVALALWIALGNVCSFANDDYGKNGRDAHSESMTVGPDGSKEGSLEAPDGYMDSNNIDEIEPRPLDEADRSEETERENAKETQEEKAKDQDDDEGKKGGFSMDATLLAAMIAAGVTIVIGEYVTNNRRKK